MITFYATVDCDSIRPYMPAVPILLPASSFAGDGMKVPKLPDHVTERAADCGGFVATFRWGDYRYSPAQYVAWLNGWQPQWAASMDYCCEPEVAGSGVRDRQQRTTEMAWHFWETYRGSPWAWVPTIQGWEIEDYARHAAELAPLIQQMAVEYQARSMGHWFRVGIGTLCRRASSHLIRSVVRTVAQQVPGVGLHLWGVKLGVLRERVALPDAVISVDSAAWNGLFGSDRELFKQSGLTMRRYYYDIALPLYREKVDAALASPKQMELELC